MFVFNARRTWTWYDIVFGTWYDIVFGTWYDIVFGTWYDIVFGTWYIVFGTWYDIVFGTVQQDEKRKIQKYEKQKQREAKT